MSDPINGPMVSEVTICNQALGWIGANSITSLDDDSTEGRWCKENYAFLRDAVLEARVWSFASARVTMETADMDPWGQMYSHVIPTTWVGVGRVYREVNNPEYPIKSAGWRRVGDNLLTNEAAVYVVGKLRISDTGKFTPMFVQALAARIAADAAIPMTENRELQRDMWQLYEAKLLEAAAVDGTQMAHEKIQSHSMVEARHMGSYGHGY